MSRNVIVDRLKNMLQFDRTEGWVRDGEKLQTGCGVVALHELYLTFNPGKEIPRDFMKRYIDAFIHVAGGYEKFDFDTYEDALASLTTEGSENFAQHLSTYLEELIDIIIELRWYLGFTVDQILVTNQRFNKYDDKELAEAGVNYKRVSPDQLVIPEDKTVLIGLNKRGGGHVIATNVRRIFNPRLDDSSHKIDWRQELQDCLDGGMEIAQITTFRSLDE